MYVLKNNIYKMKVEGVWILNTRYHAQYVHSCTNKSIHLQLGECLARKIKLW